MVAIFTKSMVSFPPANIPRVSLAPIDPPLLLSCVKLPKSVESPNVEIVKKSIVSPDTESACPKIIKSGLKFL